MVRAVVDTNIIISAFIRSGNPKKIWSAFLSNRYALLLSSSMLDEITGVMERPKFHAHIREEDRKEILVYLKLIAENVEPSKIVNTCRDPKDNHILSCAVEAKADFIVTGDKDLLVLHPFRGISILTPKEFLSRLRS